MVAAMPEQQIKYMTDKIPKKRCGTIEESVATACWIVSEEASFNTGFTFDLSGGRSLSAELARHTIPFLDQSFKMCPLHHRCDVPCGVIFRFPLVLIIISSLLPVLAD
jgi:hypothetical protein